MTTKFVNLFRSWRSLYFLVYSVALIIGFSPTILRIYHLEQAAYMMNQGLAWSPSRQNDTFPRVVDSNLLDTALNHLSSAILQERTHLQSYRLAAQVFAARGKLATAKEQLEKAHAIAPYDQLVIWDIALISEQFFHNSENDDVNISSELIMRMRANWSALGLTAQTFFLRGEQARVQNLDSSAIQWYKRALVMDPEFGSAWQQLARRYKAGQAWGKALEAYQEASMSSPHNREIWSELGQVLEHENMWNEAADAYETGARMTTGKTGQSLLFFRLGYVRQFFTSPIDREGAWRAYSSALVAKNFTPEEQILAETNYRRGQLLASSGQWNDALNEFEKVLDRVPQHYWALYESSASLWQLGKTFQAELRLRRAIDIKPKQKESYKRLASFLTIVGHDEEAQLLYQKVLEIDPKDQDAVQSLALLR